MIEIVIKIPNFEWLKNEEDFKTAVKEYEQGTRFDKEIRNALINGTPLPEHHGRLGDLDALEEYFRNVRKELKASDYKSGIEFFVRDEMLLNFQQFIHLCDAIIEGSEA